MTDTASIVASFHEDGWITATLNHKPALAFKTPRLAVYLTNRAGMGLPSNATDWMITWTDAVTGTTSSRKSDPDQPWLTVGDAIDYLPAFRLICRTCGSDDISVDAAARWDADNGCWELSATYDDRYCGNCEAEGHSILKSVLPLPNLLAEPDAA